MTKKPASDYSKSRVTPHMMRQAELRSSIYSPSENPTLEERDESMKSRLRKRITLPKVWHTGDMPHEEFIRLLNR